MRSLAVGVLGFTLLLVASPAEAQSDFSGLHLQVGDVIYVTRPSGTEVGGMLTEISPTLIAIEGYRFSPEPGLTIARRGDTVWNGILIGFGVGLLAGATLGAEACLDDPLVYCALGGGLTYAGIGALIDLARVGRTDVYHGTTPGLGRAPHIVPVVTADRKAIALSFRF
jgi:hypothetical protein